VCCGTGGLAVASEESSGTALLRTEPAQQVSYQNSIPVAVSLISNLQCICRQLWGCFVCGAVDCVRGARVRGGRSYSTPSIRMVGSASDPSMGTLLALVNVKLHWETAYVTAAVLCTVQPGSSLTPPPGIRHSIGGDTSDSGGEILRHV
jgi:hypothetical protein